MCTTFRNTFFLMAFLAVLSLAACDTVGEQNVDWRPGDALGVVGPITESGGEYDGQLGTAYFYVQAHNREQTYNWSVSPKAASSEVLRDGLYYKVEFDTPGSYTITVSTTIDGKKYSGEATASISAEE